MSVTSLNLYQRIKQDVSNKHTLDIPDLRYQGVGVPIFLWDDLQDYVNFTHVLSQEAMGSYKYINGTCLTTDKYLPFYDLKGDTYQAYCLSDVSDLDNMVLDDHQDQGLLPIKGKLITLSLKAVIELDKHYRNEWLFSREKIGVKPMVGPNQSPLYAYAYFNQRDDIADYNREEDVWEIKDNLDLLPLTVRDDNFYEM